VVDDGDRDGQFVLGRWVLVAVGLDLALDHKPVFSFAVVGGIWESIQFEGLADGTKRDLNGASSDLIALPVVTSPDPDSKTEKEVDSDGVWHMGEHGVHSMEGTDEFLPMRPIAEPLIVIRSHDPSVDVISRSSEKIRKLSLSLKRKMLHELFCSGKVSEKICKNSVSEMANVLAATECLLKVCDATSAIRFLTPAMETEIRGEASLAWMRMANARARRPATADLDELSLFVQLTVGVLSHHATMWTCFSATKCSSTR
jgi:hypothetical protein